MWMNNEVIANSTTGNIIPIQYSKVLALAMLKMVENPEIVATMSQNSLIEAKEYHLETVWPKIEKLIN